MKKVVLNTIAAALMVLGLGSVATMSPAYADDTAPATTGGTSGSNNWADCANGSPDCLTTNSSDGVFSRGDLMGTLSVIINVVVGVVGFVAVVMIVLGGISYATSQGDAAKTKKAQNTILYGVIGLIVALLAFAIVNFVLTNVFGS